MRVFAQYVMGAAYLCTRPAPPSPLSNGHLFDMHTFPSMEKKSKLKLILFALDH